MKKILITLTLILSFLLSFAQETTFSKSSRMSYGYKDENTGEFKFGPFQDIEPVFIKIRVNEITINSKVPQFYYINSAAIPLENAKGSYWYALDNKDTRCRVYLYMDAFSDIFVGVEYSDYSWIYNIHPVK